MVAVCFLMVGVFTGGHRVPWQWCRSVDSLVVPPGSLQRATVVSAGAVPWLNEVRVVGMSTDVLISQSRRTLNGEASGVPMQ